MTFGEEDRARLYGCQRPWLGISCKCRMVDCEPGCDLIFILKDPSGYCMQPGLEGGKSESEIRGRYRSCFGGSNYVSFQSYGLSLINSVMWIEWNMKRRLAGHWKLEGKVWWIWKFSIEQK